MVILDLRVSSRLRRKLVALPFLVAGLCIVFDDFLVRPFTDQNLRRLQGDKYLNTEINAEKFGEIHIPLEGLVGVFDDSVNDRPGRGLGDSSLANPLLHRISAINADLGRPPAKSTTDKNSRARPSRSLSRNLGNGECEWTNPVLPVENSTLFGTAIVAYPGSGKRTAFLQMEGMTEIKAGDDYDLSGNHVMKGFVKTSFPHHGESPLSTQPNEILLLFFLEVDDSTFQKLFIPPPNITHDT